MRIIIICLIIIIAIIIIIANTINIILFTLIFNNLPGCHPGYGPRPEVEEMKDKIDS